jgi:hypothetical protein
MKQRSFEAFFTIDNIEQLGFQYGYLSIKEKLKLDGQELLRLAPPNKGVVQDIHEHIKASVFVDTGMASTIRGAVTKIGQLHHGKVQAAEEELQKALTEFARNFKDLNGRRFASEDELRLLVSSWATFPADVGIPHPLQVVTEVGVPLSAEEGRAKRFDSLFHWLPRGEDCSRAVLVEWGLAKEDGKKLDTLVKEKVKQIRDNSYVDRALKFHNSYLTGKLGHLVAVAIGCKFQQDGSVEFAVKVEGQYHIDAEGKAVRS